PRPPAVLRVLSSKSATSSKKADQFNARWMTFVPLLNVEFKGVEKRGPAANSQTTPSVRPFGWQLAQETHPWSDISPSVTPLWGSTGPMELLKNSLPRWTLS